MSDWIADAANLFLERLDRIVATLERVADALERGTPIEDERKE